MSDFIKESGSVNCSIFKLDFSFFKGSFNNPTALSLPVTLSAGLSK